jgi:hypothetical protein
MCQAGGALLWSAVWTSAARIVTVAVAVLMGMLAGAVGAEALGAGQEPATASDARRVDGRIKLFLDCTTYGCDDVFFVSGLTFVDHVRDREVADVHVLVLRQNTGAGGSHFDIEFIGLGPFRGVTDVLTYDTAPEAARDLTRAGLLRRIKIGLMRYVAHSAVTDSVRIEADIVAPAVAEVTPKRDPWDHWVMRLRFNGQVNGESLSHTEMYSGGASASRITEAWKLGGSSNVSYRKNAYKLTDGTIYTAVTRDYGVSGLAVKSLTHHWSIGARASMAASTYTNIQRAIAASPAIEYDFFPYSESARRMLTLQYAAGMSAYWYRQLTIDDRMSDVLPLHSLGLRLDARQPWGQVSGGISGSQFLARSNKYRLDASANLELRVKKGLSLNVGGSSSLVRDQIYLPRGEATLEEILVRQRQLATSYQYQVFLGVSYTFGSIYNNVVNPRFGGS